MKTISLYCFFFFLFISCGGNKRNEEAARLIAQWQGKKIVFPENIVFTRYLTDTTDYRIPDSDYKVLIYVDSAGCTTCKVQLSKWKELIASVDSLTGREVPFLFFFHPKDYREMRYILKEVSFDLPVCIDIEDTLNKLNRFLPDAVYQTFLLNKENKVVLVGNPVYSVAMKDLYLKEIVDENSSQDGQLKTTVAADVTDVNMGNFQKQETKQAVFTLQNTGDHPLVIADVAVTCGCADVHFDKHPASPGESLKVTVDMTPKDGDFFSETITVKTNTREYIKLTIHGRSE
jgi:hypothetical protein